MAEATPSGHYSRLSEEDPFDHMYESRDSEEVYSRVFWSEDSLKFVNHFEYQDAAEVLEIQKGDEEVEYYTVGGMTRFNDTDVRERLECQINNVPPGNAIEYLEEARGTIHSSQAQEEVAETLEAVVEELREEVPPESYLA